MQPRQKTVYSSQQLENIFSNNSFLFLIQFPFENPEQLSRLNQELAVLGFICKKLSRSSLSKQLFSSKASFIPCTNSSYLITENENSKKANVLQPVLQLIEKNRGVLFFFRQKNQALGTEIWYDQSRLMRSISLPVQPSFHSQLIHLIQTQSVLHWISIASGTTQLLKLLLFVANQKKTSK